MKEEYFYSSSENSQQGVEEELEIQYPSKSRYSTLRYTRQVDKMDVMHPFKRYFWSTCSVGGPVLSLGDATVNNNNNSNNKTLKVLALIGCTLWWGKYRQCGHSLNPSNICLTHLWNIVGWYFPVL